MWWRIELENTSLINTNSLRHLLVHSYQVTCLLCLCLARPRCWYMHMYMGTSVCTKLVAALRGSGEQSYGSFMYVVDLFALPCLSTSVMTHANIKLGTSYLCMCVERQRHNKQINYIRPGQLVLSKGKKRAVLGGIRTHNTLQSRRALNQLNSARCVVNHVHVMTY